MHNRSLKIKISNGDFNCRVLGKGRKNIIAFHGFGQDGNIFIPMINSTANYTIYSFDLPFHGKSEINEKTSYFSKDEIVGLVQELLDETGITQFSILAFSIGAKFTFPIIESFGSRIENIWLLAPDGIYENFWYRLFTNNPLTRHLLQFLLKKQLLLERVAGLLLNFKLIDHELTAMAKNSATTKEKREQVYNTWIYVKNLKWNAESLNKVLKKNKLRIYIMLGTNDRIISKPKIERESKHIDNLEVILLSCGHHNLIKKFSEWMQLEIK